MVKKAILALEDGTIYEGLSFGADAPTYGEVVFKRGTRRFLPIRPTPDKLSA